MKRNQCYCESIPREKLESQGIPKGYCALCDDCGSPGHLQHFPGAVPYTGSWCDDCFLQLKRKKKVKTLCFFAIVVIGVCFLVYNNSA